MLPEDKTVMRVIVTLAEKAWLLKVARRDGLPFSRWARRVFRQKLWDDPYAGTGAARREWDG